MANNSFEEFIASATQSIQSGQFGQAVELLDQAIALQPTDSDAHMLRGIALAQTGSGDQATDAFRESVRLAPTNAKAHYNLAKHLQDMGDANGARASATEALRIDPANAAARDLMDRLGIGAAPGGEVPQMSSPVDQPGPQQGGVYYRAADAPVAHSIQFIERMGKTWTTIGWSIAILGVALFLYNLPQQSALFSQMMTDPGGFQRRQSQMAFSTPLAIILATVGMLRALASILWMIFDVVDRRNKMLWLLPFFVCCCCGFDWAVLMIYLLGEKRTN